MPCTQCIQHSQNHPSTCLVHWKSYTQHQHTECLHIISICCIHHAHTDYLSHRIIWLLCVSVNAVLYCLVSLWPSGTKYSNCPVFPFLAWLHSLSLSLSSLTKNVWMLISDRSHNYLFSVYCLYCLWLHMFYPIYKRRGLNERTFSYLALVRGHPRSTGGHSGAPGMGLSCFMWK